MKRKLCLMLILCLLYFGGAGCTKEKAIALQDASLKLVDATEKATSNVEVWWNERRSSVSDLTGKTLDDKVKTLSEEIVGGGTDTSIATLRKEFEKIETDLSPDDWVKKKLLVLNEGTLQMKQSLINLDKGYILATDAVKDLKPYSKMVFESFATLAIDLRDFPMPEQELDDDHIAIRRINKDESKADEIKRLQIAEHLRYMAQKRQDYKESRDEMIVSLLLAASYSMDILQKIDNYDKLSLKDILGIVNKWAPLAVKLSGGKLSQSEMDKVLNNVESYAIKIGVLEEGKKAEVVEEDNKTETDASNIVSVPPPL